MFYSATNLFDVSCAFLDVRLCSRFFAPDALQIDVNSCVTAKKVAGSSIMKTRLFKYIENFITKKTESFQIKILNFFIFLLKT